MLMTSNHHLFRATTRTCRCWLSLAVLFLAMLGGCHSATPAGRDSIEMIRVAGGRFLRGSPLNESWRLHDETEQWVTLPRPFLLGVTEITQEQWREIMNANPSHFQAGAPNRPVENISWLEAVEFCNRLSGRDGFTPCYRLKKNGALWRLGCSGYRLPTEAEWEFSARAGTSTPFSTGSCLDSARANYNGGFPLPSCPTGESREQPLPAKSFPPNALGFYEMHGNVAEWNWDWHAPYLAEPETDPIGPRRAAFRIARGGSWFDPAAFCRSASRGKLAPEKKSPLIGLRVARSTR